MSPDRAEKIIRRAIKNPVPPPKAISTIEQTTVDTIHFHNAFSIASILAALSTIPYYNIHGAGIGIVVTTIATFLIIYLPLMKIQDIRFLRKQPPVTTAEIVAVETRTKDAHELSRRMWEDEHLTPLKDALVAINDIHSTNLVADESGRVRYNGNVVDNTEILSLIKR